MAASGVAITEVLVARLAGRAEAGCDVDETLRRRQNPARERATFGRNDRPDQVADWSQKRR